MPKKKEKKGPRNYIQKEKIIVQFGIKERVGKKKKLPRWRPWEKKSFDHDARKSFRKARCQRKEKRGANDPRSACASHQKSSTRNLGGESVGGEKKKNFVANRHRGAVDFLKKKKKNVLIGSMSEEAKAEAGGGGGKHSKSHLGKDLTEGGIIDLHEREKLTNHQARGNKLPLYRNGPWGGGEGKKKEIANWGTGGQWKTPLYNNETERRGEKRGKEKKVDV